MLIAPHPDDEALACSVILQQAVRDGTAIRIVYVTDGDDNPGHNERSKKDGVAAQRIENAGEFRRAEALAALVSSARPCGHSIPAVPDQGLTISVA